MNLLNLVLLLLLVGKVSADAEAKPTPESEPNSDPDPRFVTSDGLIIDNDAIVVSADQESRSPRQYRGRQAQQPQRTAASGSQTAKDLVSGESLSQIFSNFNVEI